MESNISIQKNTASDTERDGDLKTQLSVVIAIRDPQKADPLHPLYLEYKEQVLRTGLSFEFIFVVEGNHPSVVEELVKIKESGENITILVFAKWYGDSTVLSAGFDHAAGDIIMTLPVYRQIDPDSIPGLLTGLEENDMVAVRRYPRHDGFFSKIQVRIFHFILRGLLGFNFHDLGCSVRIFRKSVIKKIEIFGDQHRFLPVLASHHGFRVREMDAPQARDDKANKVLAAGLYVNRILDLMSIFFLAKFTKKPLRFFGFSGFLIFVGGSLITVILAFQRIFNNIPLADRPMLLLGVLLIVLGTLLFAIGLIGEMIIFTHAKAVKEYTIDKIIN
ncbi:MAG: glycosyltransferase [Candidatus Marinimicrobia bacterium]|nr:glycosyltransferase [Candidatus Neomarinimicrobiota bacterium]